MKAMQIEIKEYSNNTLSNDLQFHDCLCISISLNIFLKNAVSRSFAEDNWFMALHVH